MTAPLCPSCRRPGEETVAGAAPGRLAGWCDGCRVAWFLDQLPPPPPPDYPRSSADRHDVELDPGAVEAPAS